MKTFVVILSLAFCIVSLNVDVSSAQEQQQELLPQSSWLETLRERTCLTTSPAAPRNVLAIPGDGKVELAWLRPSNRPCGVSYEVQVVAAAIGLQRTFTASSSRLTITGLQNGISHKFIVKAISSLGTSEGTETTATPQAPPPTPSIINRPLIPSLGQPIASVGWTCTPITTPPSCEAALNGLCQPLTCAQLAGADTCSSPLLKITDWESRTVKQYCSGECGCAASPSLRRSMEEGLEGDACCRFGAGEYWRDAYGRNSADL